MNAQMNDSVRSPGPSVSSQSGTGIISSAFIRTFCGRRAARQVWTCVREECEGLTISFNDVGDNVTQIFNEVT